RRLLGEGFAADRDPDTAPPLLYRNPVAGSTGARSRWNSGFHGALGNTRIYDARWNQHNPAVMPRQAVGLGWFSRGASIREERGRYDRGTVHAKNLAHLVWLPDCRRPDGLARNGSGDEAGLGPGSRLTSRRLERDRRDCRS